MSRDRLAHVNSGHIYTRAEAQCSINFFSLSENNVTYVLSFSCENVTDTTGAIRLRNS